MYAARAKVIAKTLKPSEIALLETRALGPTSVERELAVYLLAQLADKQSATGVLFQLLSRNENDRALVVFALLYAEPEKSRPILRTYLATAPSNDRALHITIDLLGIIGEEEDLNRMQLAREKWARHLDHGDANWAK